MKHVEKLMLDENALKFFGLVQTYYESLEGHYLNCVTTTNFHEGAIDFELMAYMTTIACLLQVCRESRYVSANFFTSKQHFKLRHHPSGWLSFMHVMGTQMRSAR